MLLVPQSLNHIIAFSMGVGRLAADFFIISHHMNAHTTRNEYDVILGHVEEHALVAEVLLALEALQETCKLSQGHTMFECILEL